MLSLLPTENLPIVESIRQGCSTQRWWNRAYSKLLDFELLLNNRFVGYHQLGT